jgi:hypothetical protein
MKLQKTLSLLALTICALATPELALASRADFVTAYNYTVRYLPRIQTWAGQLSAIEKGHVNKLIGPESPMSPEYKAVVAINVDTLYTSATIDLAVQPQILTLPQYDYSYSILQVDVFGNVLSTGLTNNSTGGTYALVGPNYKGSLPDGVKRIEVPENWSQLAIRTSLYTLNVDGTSYIDTQSNAAAFRASTRLQSLSAWTASPTSGGETQILPISGNFSVPTKTIVDALAQTKPREFLELLQTGMESPSTTPLSASDRILISEFRDRFAAAKSAAAVGSITSLSDICAGARAAHDAIVANWHFNTVGNNWVHFNNMGEWGDAYLDRASGDLYIQYCNNRKAAYYAQAFLDNHSEMLTGVGNRTYTITFAADQIPDCERFWSITAYTSDAIELVPNAANKYAVASYTPGLVTTNGSITITLKTIGSNETTVAPNVLPIPEGRFSVMLRVYGPGGTALAGTYVPPAVVYEDGKTPIKPIPSYSKETPSDWFGGLKSTETPQSPVSSVIPASVSANELKPKKNGVKGKSFAAKKAKGGSKKSSTKKTTALSKKSSTKKA